MLRTHDRAGYRYSEQNDEWYYKGRNRAHRGIIARSLAIEVACRVRLTRVWRTSVSMQYALGGYWCHRSQRKSCTPKCDAPAKVATQVRSMAKRRRLSANRMLIELAEEGLEAKQQKEKAFFELAERFRSAEDPKEVERLGEELGQMVFGK